MLAAPVAALVAELLHEMGQPLTTLGSCRLLPLLAPADRDELVSEMAGQVERVTEIYRGLRSLFDAGEVSGGEAEAAVSLRELLQDAADERRPELDRRGVALILDAQGAEPGIEVGRCTQHAIRGVLAAAVAQAGAGGEVRAGVAALREDMHSEQTGGPLLTIEVPLSGLAEVQADSATAPVALRVAAAMAEADGGRVVYNVQPFRATMELPGVGDRSSP